MSTRVRIGITFIACLLITALSTDSSFAILQRRTSELPDFDKRTNTSIKQSQTAVSAEVTASIEKLKTRVPDAKVDFDTLLCTPKWIASTDHPLKKQESASGSASAKSAPNKNAVIKAFISENQAVFGHGPEVLDNEPVLTDYTDSDTGLRTVIWEQRINGIPVFESQMKAHVNKHGELVNIGSSILPNAHASSGDSSATGHTITAKRAIIKAAESFGVTITDSDLTIPTDSEASNDYECFTAPQLDGEAHARLVYLPMNKNSVKLCWMVTAASKSRHEMFQFLIDAASGEPVVRRNITCNSLASQPVMYHVYDSDSPTPFSPGWSSPNTAQPDEVARTFLSIIGPTTIDVNGWLNDGDNNTQGNNVRSQYNADIYNPQYATGSPYRVFDASLDISGNPANYKAASTFQNFYLCNQLHDLFYNLGFTEYAGNCQLDNFGRGGKSNDRLRTFTQNCTDNAYCYPAVDGQSINLVFGVWHENGTRDSGLDSEVVIHEFTHAVSNRLVGGPNVLISSAITCQLGEGWSDFFSLVIMSDLWNDNLNGNYSGCYAPAAYSMGNYYFGVRRYPYTTDMSKNPLRYGDTWHNYTYSNIPKNPTSWISADPAECHNAGEVWCLMLWEMRQNLMKRLPSANANYYSMKLVIDGMKLGPANPNWIQARDAILQADTVDFAGVYHQEIWEAFAKRGLGYSAAVNSEKFDMPPLTNTVAIPSFNPPGAIYLTANKPTVTMTSATTGATIRYTLDGSEPTSTSTQYTTPVTINGSYYLKAKAFKSGMTNSATRSNFYSIVDAVTAPTLSPGSGSFSSPDYVTITCATSGATIRYTTDGSDPNVQSTIYNGSIYLGHDTTIKAQAWKTGLIPSAVTTGTYTVRSPVYVDTYSSGTVHDGTSWATAFKTIQEGINAASSCEVWVAAGTYNEKITLKSGASLYGGFSGDELVKTQRDYDVFGTIINGGGSGTVVTSPSGLTTSTRIDGFIIQNGNASFGGAIFCSASSPTIANNKIRNSTASYGGGICCYNNSEPVITMNTFSGNSGYYGAAISLIDSSPGIYSSIFYGNNSTGVGGGIYCEADSAGLTTPNVTNNSFYNNTAPSGGGGIYCNTYSSPNLTNNIIAWNSTGIKNFSANATPTLTKNNVYNNTSGNYVGLPAGATDISVDPAFADRFHNNLHIRNTSPCRNVGYTPGRGLPRYDIDGQARIEGEIADIGADESYGETYSIVIRVKPNSTTNGPGDTWSNAWHLISSALGVALPGDEIWVAAGTYTEVLTTKNAVALYGGFAGTETDRELRSWRSYISTLSTERTGVVITVPAGATDATIIDGFKITLGQSARGGGIYCMESSTPVIANNTFTGNVAQDIGGGGIYCESSSPTIVNNLFYSNISENYGGAIYADRGNPIILNNTLFENNTSTTKGGGICLTRAGGAITNNIIINNSGGGIWMDTSTPPTILHNDVCKNKGGDYIGIANQTEFNGNISVDALFVSTLTYDFHLSAGSLCIDTGIDDGAPATDLDGFLRPQDGNGDMTDVCDMGAFEHSTDFSTAKATWPDNSRLSFGGLSITAVLPDRGLMYAEKLDRSNGIGFQWWGDFNVGDIVNVSGQIVTDANTGERFMSPECQVSRAGGNIKIESLYMPLRNLGGAPFGLEGGVTGGNGLNNIGLLVRVCGIVKTYNTGTKLTWFTIDDGSGSNIKVVLPYNVNINPIIFQGHTAFVTVAGISSSELINGEVRRLVRLRSSTDLNIYQIN